VIQVVEQGIDEFLCHSTLHAAPEGSVVIINPHEVHTGRSVDAVPLRYRSMYPTVELFCDIAAQLDDRLATLPHFRGPVISDQQLARMLIRAHCALERAELWLEASCLLTQALGYLIQHYTERPPHRQAIGNEPAVLRRVKAYLNEHVAEDISLEQLAQTSGFSPFHLIHVFRNATGLAPYEYLINLRIERAKQLLTGQHSIAYIAASLGFYDQSHLHRHFKRIVGVTPGAYRKESTSSTTHSAISSHTRTDL
jgi:AraC-like DNA-binding protein